jgi:hypothetical protein
MEEPIVYYIKPTFFDWGVYKPHGWWILLGSLFAYAACIAISVTLVARMGRRLLYKSFVFWAAFLALIALSYAAAKSVLLQLSSRHYQERTHIPALAVMGVSLGMIVGGQCWLLWFRRPPDGN